MVSSGKFCCFEECVRAAGLPSITSWGFVPAYPIPTWDGPKLPPKAGAEPWAKLQCQPGAGTLCSLHLLHPYGSVLFI